MRLIRLRIGSFRGEEDLNLEFGSRADTDPALAFLVGPNGVGKSRVLEVLGRIFSHLAAGIPPGLDFDLEYELGPRRVRVTSEAPELEGSSAGPRLEPVDAWLLVAEDDSESWRSGHLRDRWPGDLGEILPYLVIGLSTGPNSRLDWALRRSLQETLAENLLPASQTEPPSSTSGEREADIEAEQTEQARQLRLADVATRCIPLSGNELGLAVLALLGHPGATDEKDWIRDKLLTRVGLHPQGSLFAFAFVVAPDWRVGLPAPQHQLFERLLKKAARRVVVEPDSGDSGSDTEEVAQRVVFEMNPDLREWIGATADTPFIWFNQMLGWLKAGAIESVHLVLKKRSGDRLLVDSDFSDGEFLFAGRYGLLQLLKGRSDFLVLFDEPETHFNDRWKVELIYDLEQVLKGGAAQVVIATHSDLTISDADRADVRILEADPETDAIVPPRQPPVSPFGANRDQITRKVFGAEGGTGKRAATVIADAIESDERERMEDALERVGPGFHRFHLEVALRKKGDDDAA